MLIDFDEEQAQIVHQVARRRVSEQSSFQSSGDSFPWRMSTYKTTSQVPSFLILVSRLPPPPCAVYAAGGSASRPVAVPLLSR